MLWDSKNFVMSRIIQFGMNSSSPVCEGATNLEAGICPIVGISLPVRWSLSVCSPRTILVQSGLRVRLVTIREWESPPTEALAVGRSASAAQRGAEVCWGTGNGRGL